MIFQTEKSIFKISIINGGRYGVKKVGIAVVPGNNLIHSDQSVPLRKIFEGNRIVLDEEHRLVLYDGDVKILVTTTITSL